MSSIHPSRVEMIVQVNFKSLVEVTYEFHAFRKFLVGLIRAWEEIMLTDQGRILNANLSLYGFESFYDEMWHLFACINLIVCFACSSHQHWCGFDRRFLSRIYWSQIEITCPKYVANSIEGCRQDWLTKALNLMAMMGLTDFTRVRENYCVGSCSFNAQKREVNDWLSF